MTPRRPLTAEDLEVVTCPTCGSLTYASRIRDGRCPDCDLCLWLVGHELQLFEMANHYPLPHQEDR